MNSCWLINIIILLSDDLNQASINERYLPYQDNKIYRISESGVRQK